MYFQLLPIVSYAELEMLLSNELERAVVCIQREGPALGDLAEVLSIERELPRLRTIDRACVLFTDLVGSTWLWETEPDAMARALERHDALLEQTIRSHGGHVFKWMGDGCCARFPVDGAAPAAALAIRSAFRAEPWHTMRPLRLRIALHAGPVRNHRSDDLVGRTMNQTARLLELCAGDQVLATACALEGTHELARAIPWQPRGRTMLRDVEHPIEIFEACPAEDLERPRIRAE